MKLSKEKKEIIDQLLIKGEGTIRSIAQKVNVSEQTIYSYRRKLIATGKLRKMQKNEREKEETGSQEHRDGFRTPNNYKRYTISRY